MEIPAFDVRATLTTRRIPGLRRPWTFLAFAFALACRPPYPAPPETAREPVTDTLHGVVFTDPYRWLEDEYSPETRAWIDEQNEYAERIIGEPFLRTALEHRLTELMDVPGAIYPRRSGDYEYFSLRKTGHEVAVIYRRPVPETPEEGPLDPTADFEVVIDPRSFNPDGTVSVGIRDFSPDGGLMLYAIRDGGRDEVEIRVRNLATGEDLRDRLPVALYSSVSFTPDGTGFYYSRRSRQTGARIRLHVLGTDIREDVALFGEGNGPDSFVSAFQAEGGRYLVYTVQHGWARTDVYLQDMASGAPPIPVVAGQSARFSPRFVEGELYLLTNLDAPNNRLVAVDPEAPDPAAWRKVLPQADDVMTGYQVIEGRIYAHYLHNVSSRIVRYDLDGTETGEIIVPRHHVATLRPWREGTALLTLASLLTPAHVLKLDLETLEAETWLESSVPFTGSDYEVRQVWYTSRDGTRAPMYIAHGREFEPDGTAPTLLYGYGGFNVSLLPRFDVRAAAWLEQGGVYAMATLRGGGEFGETWHRAGMLENKQNVFDDFISAAEWLIANGYTHPDRLAIRGVSNGGLLVGSALTQRPDLFRAVFCGFPDLDMVRFYQFTDTNNLPALLEYGNAAIPEQFEVLRTFSPYQNVRDGVDYPAVMFTQGSLDTRVPPLQARKMAARLQAATASGLPVILDHDPRAGHAGGRTFTRNVRNAAMELTFLLGQLGVTGGPGWEDATSGSPGLSARFPAVQNLPDHGL